MTSKNDSANGAGNDSGDNTGSDSKKKSSPDGTEIKDGVVFEFENVDGGIEKTELNDSWIVAGGSAGAGGTGSGSVGGPGGGHGKGGGSGAA